MRIITMPTIRVELIKGRSVEQKREFAEVVTREAARILECSPEVVDVVFQDVERHDWAVGGKLASEQ
jgi:4-oxalocrotonate tautomerase